MLAFRCPRCGQLVFFENTECLRCGQRLGFDPDQLDVVAADGGARACANQRIAGCNWLVTDGASMCRSCRLTRTRPSDFDSAALVAFADTEAAKRRVVFQLMSLDLPLDSWAQRRGGLGYDLLSSEFTPVTTGHQDGIITIDLAESDDPHREQVRLEMGEPYRTMLGHLRHETGHYYWPLLVERAGHLEEFRALFGDERLDYAQAMDRHYNLGPLAGWEEYYVSAYATMHPWEDWAETFAHYLHIRDTLQTAAAYGVQVNLGDLAADPTGDLTEPFGKLLADWLPLTYALNAINRSMGRDDLYPFVLSAWVVNKLSWVHRVMVN